MRSRRLALAVTLALTPACNAVTGASGLSLGTATRGSTTDEATTSASTTSAGGAGGASTSTGGAGGGSMTSTTSTTSTTSSTTTTTSSTTTTDTDSLDAAAQHCVDTINAYRKTMNLAPYARWKSAEPCSNDEAAKDGVSGQAHGAFGSCGEHAQNECPGWPGPPYSLLDGCLQQMWNEGPGDFYGGHGHYINMSSTQYSQVACGFAKAADGSWWAVQNFQ
jgi:hypothetical protein